MAGSMAMRGKAAAPRNHHNIRSDLKGNMLTFAGWIVGGNRIDIENFDIPKTWFTKPFDNHGNKLVAFAAKVALQKGATNTNGNRSNHAKIFEDILIKAKKSGSPVLTTAYQQTHYMITHVIANHNLKSGQNAAVILRILKENLPKAVINKALKAKFNKQHSPGSQAERRGRQGVNVARKLRQFRNFGTPTTPTPRKIAAAARSPGKKKAGPSKPFVFGNSSSRASFKFNAASTAEINALRKQKEAAEKELEEMRYKLAMHNFLKNNKYNKSGNAGNKRKRTK